MRVQLGGGHGTPECRTVARLGAPLVKGAAWFQPEEGAWALSKELSRGPTSDSRGVPREMSAKASLEFQTCFEITSLFHILRERILDQIS